MFLTKSVEKLDSTHFIFKNLLKSCCLWDSVEKYCTAGQATDGDIVHAHCMLDTYVHTHTHTHTQYVIQLGMLQRTVFTNKIRIPQRTQTVQRTGRNILGRRGTRVRITFRAFSLWLQRHSSSLSFVTFSYQFSYFAYSSVNIFLKIILLYNFSHEPAK